MFNSIDSSHQDLLLLVFCTAFDLLDLGRSLASITTNSTPKTHCRQNDALESTCMLQMTPSVICDHTVPLQRLTAIQSMNKILIDCERDIVPADLKCGGQLQKS